MPAGRQKIISYIGTFYQCNSSGTTTFTSEPKSKQDKVKVTNPKKLPKIQILQENLHVTYLLKLLDKMYKYKMDPTRTVRATERTRDAGRT